ncbi:hypothetical protein MHU86_14582 [Fragilaria crotonensis]|nr:hypothetical protein MHU86_14582 [Fragilaria crotonensis]
MSAPPSPIPGTPFAAVTPGVEQDPAPPRIDRFVPELLDRIVSLLAPTQQARGIIRAGIDALFSEHWQARDWCDLMVFTSADISTALVQNGVVPEELTAPVIVKKLGYIVDYARIGELTESTTMTQILSTVTSLHHSKPSTSSNASSPARRSVQIFDKKAVPTLDKFSGHDEDYFAWRESTINILGTAGFGRFLDETTWTDKYPEVSESVFYALRGAVHGGQAQSIAQSMLDDKQLDPVVLWSGLESYYNTALNRANVVLFDIRRLLNLRLTPDNTATKFISDVRDCLQRLRKNNAQLADDTATLRALLLVAIQDDDFEIVRDSIVQKPNSSLDQILTEIRERDTSLMMKDQASNVAGDGASTTRYSRRAQSATASKTGKRQPTPGPAPDNRKWLIPRLPDSWKKSFGAALFKLVLDWRTDAHKGETQLQLNDAFDTIIETYRPVTKSRKTGSGASSGAPILESGSTEASVNAGETPAQGGDEAPPRKRIRLQKSRRVVTERST